VSAVEFDERPTNRSRILAGNSAGTSAASLCFLKETIDCFEAGANRATIAMCWILTMDHLIGHVLKNQKIHALRRSDFRICHRSCPGNLYSQKVHPFTALPVMLIAAADGLSKRCPCNTSAPEFTRARYALPL
jgi:hypothetical protein